VHKFFAKTLFFGKNVEYLTECHSTNDELLNRARSVNLPEGSLLISDFQIKGKGQRGNHWESEKGKNLLFSLLIKPNFLELNKQHLITFIAAIAVKETIKKLLPESKKVLIKWPNDVFVNQKKIAGILTESSISKGIIEMSVLGVGMNINQHSFEVDTATSLYIETGSDFDRETILNEVMQEIEKLYLMLKAQKFDFIMNAYLNDLLWKHEMHTFKMRDKSEIIQGTITGVNDEGHLKIKTNDLIRTFNFREIQFVK
jgi:BirA family biotin operon repressor/biotin-[acetyl-CoA-carboxylase] ligase